MKRLRLLVLAGAVALALPFGLVAAHATGSTGGTATNTISIDPYADFDTFGTNIDVKVYVKCSGTATVDVTLHQEPPETPYPIDAGIGAAPVVCDGQVHSTGVTVAGAGFDTGWATATATLLGTANATATRTVYIQHV